MGFDTLRDAVQGYPVKVDSAGSLAVKPAAWTVTGTRGGDVTGTATMLADDRSGRVYIRFVNNGGAAVFLYAGSGVTTNDLRLAPGESMEFHGGYAGEWWGITASTTERVSVVEFVAS